MKYADENKILLDLNEKDDDGEYPILLSVYRGIKYVKLLIEYADKHHIILEMNDHNKNKRYPLLMATFKNNIEIVQYLINYASNHGLILDLNKKLDIINIHKKNEGALSIEVENLKEDNIRLLEMLKQSNVPSIKI